ncbi:MAG: VWA domain-containing protein [Sorangiineae bacterium]|nr:VWA domain-containing protein [Sorangiineae bacterium]
MRVRRLALGLIGLVSIGGLTAIGCGTSGGDAQLGGGGAAGKAGSSSGGGAGAPASGGASGAAGTAGGGSGTGGTSGGSGTGGTSGGSGTGGSGTGGGPNDAGLDVEFSYDGPIDDGGFNSDSSCAATTAETKPLPLDMYVMLDQSGSMNTDCNVNTSTYTASTPSKWCYAINALYGFMATADPTLDQRVALQYFALNNGTCAGVGYATPEISLRAIPANAGDFVASLNSHSPSTNTPTEGAARGLTQFAAAQKSLDPSRTIIGILITDGDPYGCGDAATVGTVIRNAWNGGSGVRTYVIGMTGATAANLETMAVNGGAPAHANYCISGASCHYYSVGNGNYAVFADVLKTIQASAIGCDYAMPTSDAGVIDPGKVSVEYSPGGNPPAQTIPKVSGAGSCPAAGSGGGGWYYDNDASPTKITLCPATCTAIQSDHSAKVEVNLGCLGS